MRYKLSFILASIKSLKVIPKKEHPIKNLIRRKKTESTKDTKSTNKSKIRSCFSCLSWTILLVDSLLEIT